MPRSAPGRAAVSVVIPAYNYARFLGATLDSVLAQDLPGLDVVVVDDGSTDHTPEVLAAYGRRIRTLRQANAGLCAARNAGAALARGGCLVFLDADDLLAPGALAGQLAFLDAHPEVSVAVCRSLFFERADNAGQPEPSGEWRLFRSDLDVHLCHFNVAPPHAFMLRREALAAAFHFDAKLTACEDHDLWFRLARLGHRLEANPDCLVYYRQHPGSMSRNRPNQLAHDAALHLRIAEALAESADFPVGRRAEGLLASIAGCLLTAERLALVDPALAGRLLDQAEATGRILQEQRPRPGGAPELMRYYLLRTALSLAPRLERGEKPALRLKDDLEPVLGRELRLAAAQSPEELEKAAEQAARTLYGSSGPA